MNSRPPRSTLFPYTTLFRSQHLGYTHVEFLPIMDHPFFGSWGYQITGYFAPSGNYGTPQDLMYLIDYLHQHDIGVIFRSEEHTSELQSQSNLVCRLLLEKKK